MRQKMMSSLQKLNKVQIINITQDISFDSDPISLYENRESAVFVSPGKNYSSFTRARYHFLLFPNQSLFFRPIHKMMQGPDGKKNLNQGPPHPKTGTYRQSIGKISLSGIKPRLSLTPAGFEL